jgi:hypothetical protein
MQVDCRILQASRDGAIATIPWRAPFRRFLDERRGASGLQRPGTFLEREPGDRKPGRKEPVMSDDLEFDDLELELLRMSDEELDAFATAAARFAGDCDPEQYRRATARRRSREGRSEASPGGRPAVRPASLASRRFAA